MGDPNAARFPTTSLRIGFRLGGKNPGFPQRAVAGLHFVHAVLLRQTKVPKQQYAAWVGLDFCTNREGCLYGGFFKVLASARSLRERSVLKTVGLVQRQIFD